jgi:excinuclease ABC subunit B
MERAMEETDRRRRKQLEYNKKYGITPKTIVKPIAERIGEMGEIEVETKSMAKQDLLRLAVETEVTMKRFAEELDFENAILFREKLSRIRKALGESTVSTVS